MVLATDVVDVIKVSVVVLDVLHPAHVLVQSSKKTSHKSAASSSLHRGKGSLFLAFAHMCEVGVV